MDALATKVKATFGQLDVLFVNAGYGHFMPFQEMTEAVYDEMLNLNAKGPYFIVQKLVPLMPEAVRWFSPLRLQTQRRCRP